MNAAFLPLIFISGVFYDADDAPGGIKDAAQALPLKHLIDGLSGRWSTTRASATTGWPRSCSPSGPPPASRAAVRGFSWESRSA